MIDIHHHYWRFAERGNGRLAMVGVVSLLLIKCLSQFLAASQQQQHTAMFSQLYFNDTTGITFNCNTSRLQRSFRVWIFYRSRNDCWFFGNNINIFTFTYILKCKNKKSLLSVYSIGSNNLRQSKQLIILKKYFIYFILLL